MNPRRQNILTLIRIFSDSFCVGLGWVLAYLIRFYAMEAPKGVPEASLYLKLLPFILGIWFFTFFALGFYRRGTKFRSAFLEGIDIIRLCVLAMLAFIAFTYFYAEYRYSRVVLTIFAAVHPALIIAGRSMIRKGLRWYRKKAAPRKTLLIGAGEFLNKAIAMSQLGDIARSEILGVILVQDSDGAGRRICEEKKLPIFQIQSDWAGFFGKNPAQTVIIALPYQSFSFIESELEKIANQVPDVKLLPDFQKFSTFASSIELISGVPVIGIHDSPLAGPGSLAKRLFDIVGSFAAIVLFSPLMLLIGILIPLTSRGPIFYRQERMGLDGKTFRMLKFRSMPINAELKTGAVFATADDTRATALGSILRRTSLDELPQFFNVLRGHMSLVGPRPERPVFVEKFRRDVPGYMLRHMVKAGVTGWAQVNGWRGDTSIQRRIECDLFYIQNWSLWFDIKIILLTILRGFINKNAY